MTPCIAAVAVDAIAVVTGLVIALNDMVTARARAALEDHRIRIDNAGCVGLELDPLALLEHLAGHGLP